MTTAMDRSDEPGSEALMQATDRVVELAQALRLAALHDGIDAVDRIAEHLSVAIGTVAFQMGQLDEVAAQEGHDR